VSGKVNLDNHWKNPRGIGDPSLRKGFARPMKWSEKEKDYKCEGVDRAFRTFGKVVDHAVTDD